MIRRRLSTNQGFTLVELVAVVVILGVLSITVASKFSSSSTQRLPASCDLVVAALSAGQQLAMAQLDEVRVQTGGTQVDLQVNDGSGWSSVQFGGVQYPISLHTGQTIDTVTISFNRLGRASLAGDITIHHGLDSLTVSVSESGFSH